MKPLTFMLKLAFVLLMFMTISCHNIDESDHSKRSTNPPETDILQIAKQVIEAFKLHDAKKLASFVHPVKGVRFSPSAYVDINDDKFFSSAQILTFWVDQNVYTWGYADGTGETINMTPNEYTQRYVLDRDFLRASSINVNQDMAFGNTSNNAASVYPKGTRVEFYIEPSSKESIDWSALRLVFEREGDVWYLVAVIHDEWST